MMRFDKHRLMTLRILEHVLHVVYTVKNSSAYTAFLCIGLHSGNSNSCCLSDITRTTEQCPLNGNSMQTCKGGSKGTPMPYPTRGATALAGKEVAGSDRFQLPSQPDDRGASSAEHLVKHLASSQ
jgi:hypothetical protein